MTISNDKRRRTTRGGKKLSLKKETVKDLDVGKEKAEEIGGDQLETVNGGNVVRATTRCEWHVQRSGNPQGVCEEGWTLPACVKPTVFCTNWNC